MAATPLTTAEVATELETTPRTLRKFLRADAKARGVETPGKGARYAITRTELRSLRTRFNRWQADLAAAAEAKINDEGDASTEVDEPADD